MLSDSKNFKNSCAAFDCIDLEIQNCPYHTSGTKGWHSFNNKCQHLYFLFSRLFGEVLGGFSRHINNITSSDYHRKAGRRTEAEQRVCYACLVLNNYKRAQPKDTLRLSGNSTNSCDPSSYPLPWKLTSCQWNWSCFIFINVPMQM